MEPPAHRRTRDYHRLILPGLVIMTAAAWAAVIAVDLASLPEHVWHATLAIAAVTSNACLVGLVILRLDNVSERLDAGYQAMTAHRRERPPEAMTPCPWCRGPHLAGVPHMRSVQNGNLR